MKFTLSWTPYPRPVILMVPGKNIRETVFNNQMNTNNCVFKKPTNKLSFVKRKFSELVYFLFPRKHINMYGLSHGCQKIHEFQ